MTNTQYNPRPDSLPSQVIGYFTNNPDEELLLDDIVDKFGSTRGNIHTLLASARDVGLLRRDRNEDGEYFYARGPNLKASAAQDTGVDIDSACQRRSPKPQPTKQVDPIDPLSVPIESGIPVANIRGCIMTDWSALLKRLKVGNSCKLSVDHKYSLTKAMSHAHKTKQGKFTLRTLPGKEELRIWRVA